MALSCALGCIGVGMGALGSHYLKDKMIADGQRVWTIGVQYNLLHAVAMLATRLAVKGGKLSPATVAHLSTAYKLWGAGILLFSGSLYVLAIEGLPRFPFGPMTPVGGVLLMIGWGFAGAAMLN